MRQPLTFIHCADLHLDSPFKGLKEIPEDMLYEIRESTFMALENLAKQAITYDVDFILMVGDIFDQEDQSLKAHMALKKFFEKLEAHDIQVYVSFGNHDFLNGQTFSRHYPKNVHVFESEKVTALDFFKNGLLQAKIYGFSYQNRAVLTNKIEEYEKTVEPIYHIATLHGAYGQEKESEHKNYAPFQLTELKNAGFDYWALGHIHKRAILSEKPPVIYPGNMQGRSTKETGDKGCYLVTLEETKSNLEFIPLQHIRFKKLLIDASEWKTIEGATDQLAAAMRYDESSRIFIQLKIDKIPANISDWFIDGQINEMIQYVNQQSKCTYIIDYKWTSEKRRETWHNGGKFLDELTEVFSETNPKENLKPLWKHTEGRRWLPELEQDEKLELIQDAEQLMDKLLHEKKV